MSEENKYTFENEEYRRTYWHTCSHVLAQAVKRLHPEVKLAIGPSIENGFYYDLDAPFAFTPENLAEIEGEMRKICKEKLKLERFELPREEALKYMEEREEPYKVELINDLPADAHISFYKQGEFVDLCAGPHLDSTGRIKGNAIKLTACNAAYWRGDSNRQTLQRIYGVAFPKKEELDAYLERIEEAKRRDHRKLGKELGLFMMTEEGPGFPFFLPKGMVLKNTLLDYWRQCHKRYGYVEISTPIILNQELWHRSGHWDHYKDNMYTTVIDGEDYAIKPMNCPGGMLVYKSEPHSYRDLPLRMAELGLVHRHEMSGALHGLFRVRCFTQDDAHIFMTPDQMKDEIKNVVKLFDEIYSTFGLTYQIELSTMPEDHMGDEKDWKFAEDTLQAAITEMGKDFVINAGDGGHSHPTQTLLDMMTIRRRKGRLDNLTIGFCGDLKFGRTVHSLIKSLARYDNVKFVLISPEELRVPDYIINEVLEPRGIPYIETRNLEGALPDLDILYMTRVQRERFFNEEDYIRLRDSYILTAEKLNLAPADMAVLHPLPRVNEITLDVDDDPRAAYFEQAQNGVYVRMALIMTLLGLKDPKTGEVAFEC